MANDFPNMHVPSKLTFCICCCQAVLVVALIDWFLSFQMINYFVDECLVQVEGAVNEGGRKPSIWDTFSHVPGNIKNNDNGDVACDYYHRYEEDFKLMQSMGIKHYRWGDIIMT